ncbi:zinc finger CCHC domain-containing protein 14 isoform X2 [Hypomesus transpacificus]|uniref:zinc finger CCHC domain-containing protein 14 isoform X2 n=1 Tax=Hypomesus transpacificus TaxID=137520 RepID=UPI001F083FFA|nr:zinc finger CCHC domain-containing protein 14 isoform X2 [Hypomesus transpacificus]
MKMVENRCSVQKEEVYRWFSVLSSSQRAEFLCGLLDLCVPIELRFLGSCLEDLARKDYNSLRDAEIKANNPADLSGLTNVTDEVVRSKLLVSLALLGSDNREAAGVLFRTLTHIDAVISNYGLQLNDGQTEQQFLLLFTMASNHPAFSFHQKLVLRQELSHVQEMLQSSCAGEAPGGGGGTRGLASPTPLPCPIPAASPCLLKKGLCLKNQQLGEILAGPGPCPSPGVGEEGRPGDQEGGPEPISLPSSVSPSQAPGILHLGKPGRVNVERIEMKGVTYKTDKLSEYVLEVSWSDYSTTTVVRKHQELMDLLSQVSQVCPDEGLDKLLPKSPGLDKLLPKSPCLDSAPELDRWLTSLPPHILKHQQVTLFFSSAPPGPPAPPTVPFPHSASLGCSHLCCSSSAGLGCLLQYRGTNRAVCGVASIQPVMSVHSSMQPHSPPHLPHLCHLPPHLPPQLPPQGPLVGPHPAGGETAVPPLGCLQSATLAPPTSPEQSGILEWLRKLRLHKYYPVFKQLTMEEFLGLTEEDLNKYDLTQGAKKKLKTQLELQKEKMEKKYMVSQFPVSCSGIARVTPSSHIGPIAHLQPANTELRVDVDQGSSLNRDSSSSSGYSSAPCSPRDAAFDRPKDTHRRMELGLDLPGVDRTCVLLSPSLPAGSSRPTAQVLPVQNDPTSCLSPPSQPPVSLPLVSPAPGRVQTSPRKPRPPPLGPGVRLECLFSGLGLESPPPGLQDPHGPRGPSAPSSLCSLSGLVVETSNSLTSTSNTLHHVSHPPLSLQVSSSLPLRTTGHYPYPTCPSVPSSSSSMSTFPSGSVACSSNGIPVATASSVPMATVVPGHTYSVTSVAAAVPPSSSPSPPEVCYAIAPGSSPSSSSSSPCSSVCVCSSCGCRGNCGSYGPLPANYAGYFQHPFSGTSVFTLGPLFHLSPLLATASTAGAFSYPLVAPPLYNSSMSHDPQQPQGLVLPPMQGFLGGGGNVYQPHGLLGNGVGHKRSGNASCYNCGASGHRAQECKQPPMDSLQQGIFRLKYTPHPDSQDSGD